MALYGNVQAAADTLGIEMVGHEASGLVDGCHVTVDISLTDQQNRLYVHGKLSPPLDLGLDMHRRQVVLAGWHGAETGNEDLDSEFSVSGDEPLRTRDLFTPAVCQHLLALHRAPHDFSLHDDECTLFQVYGFNVDDAWIVRAAHVVAETVALLDGARAGLPAAAPLSGHAEALRAFAATRHLAFTTAPLSVKGRLEGRPIELASVRAGKRHHHLRARATFEASLGVGLGVRKERLLEGLYTLLGGQDVSVGDEAFDRHFLVRVTPAEADRVPALLDHEVRATLLSLDTRAGDVTVDDDGITVDHIAATIAPETMLWALDALDEARARIQRNLLHGGGGGPYR